MNNYSGEQFRADGISREEPTSDMTRPLPPQQPAPAHQPSLADMGQSVAASNPPAAPQQVSSSGSLADLAQPYHVPMPPLPPHQEQSYQPTTPAYQPQPLQPVQPAYQPQPVQPVSPTYQPQPHSYSPQPTPQVQADYAPPVQEPMQSMGQGNYQMQAYAQPAHLGSTYSNRKDPTIAFLLELLGYLGFLGIGHIYAGNIIGGLLMLIFGWAVIGTMFAIFALLTLGLGLCFLPVLAIVPILSGVWARNTATRNNYQSGYKF